MAVVSLIRIRPWDDFGAALCADNSDHSTAGASHWISAILARVLAGSGAGLHDWAIAHLLPYTGAGKPSCILLVLCQDQVKLSHWCCFWYAEHNGIKFRQCLGTDMSLRCELIQLATVRGDT